MQVARRIYQVKSPLPFPPHSINCYAVDTGGGWILVDAGLNYPPVRAAWQEAFNTLGISPASIKAVYITHFHPDHYGAAGWLQNLSGAPVYMHPLDARLCDIFWKAGEGQLPVLAEHYVRNGLEPEHASELLNNMRILFPLVKPYPEITVLPEKEETRTGAGQIRIIWTPGHSDGHVCLFEEKEGALLSGDHLLYEITPNISYWPRGDENPLKNYLASMDVLENLPVRLVLPGHGRVFHNPRERIEQIKSHYGQRLKIVAREADGGRTAREVCDRIFVPDLPPDDMRLAMGETLSHLKYLEQEGLVRSRDKNGINVYCTIQ